AEPVRELGIDTAPQQGAARSAMVGALSCRRRSGHAWDCRKAGAGRSTHGPERAGAGYGPISSRARGAGPGTSMTQTLGQTLLLWYSGFVLIFFLATNSYYL